MRQLFTSLFLVAIAFWLSACSSVHCNSCHVGLPGGACEPCPKPPKKLKPPKKKRTCHLPRWPDRPVKCVATQVIRKCCDHETVCTSKSGADHKVKVCEITYRSLYSDGTTKIWTEVSRDPVLPGTDGKLKSLHPLKHSFVKNRCSHEETGSPNVNIHQRKVKLRNKNVDIRRRNVDFRRTNGFGGQGNFGNLNNPLVRD